MENTSQTHKLGDAKTLLENGIHKLINIGEKSIILARHDDEYYAFDAVCPHYGGPLEEGVLFDHTIMCPWHHACFDIRTGSRLEPPALDRINTYPVFIMNGQVIIDSEPAQPTLAQFSAPTQTFVVAGGGAAGQAAIEELRHQGFAGKIILISATSYVPVDRPNLSKEYLAGEAKPEWIPLRPMSWYKDHQIDLRLDTKIMQVDPATHTILTDNGQTYHYDKLLLATGSHAHQLTDIPGASLDNIFTLHKKTDADQIIAEIKDKSNVVIIGASFIGMEVAASLRERNANATVVDLVEVPFSQILGEDVGKFLQKVHEDNDVQFKMNTSVAKFNGNAGVVSEVVLEDGTKLPADLVIIGVGVAPNTEFLSTAGLKMNEDDQSVVVNHFMQTSDPDIYAAGDIATYPIANGDKGRIEHWRVAQQHGCVVAHNILSLEDDMSQHVPFFWTKQWDVNLRYVGFAPKWDEIIYRGNVQSGDFIAFYLLNGKLKAAAGVGRDTEMSALEFILKHDLPFSRDDMENPEFDIVELVNSATAKAN